MADDLNTILSDGAQADEIAKQLAGSAPDALVVNSPGRTDNPGGSSPLVNEVQFTPTELTTSELGRVFEGNSVIPPGITTDDTGGGGGAIPLPPTPQFSSQTNLAVPQSAVSGSPIEQSIPEIPAQAPPENGIPTIEIAAVADGALELDTDDTGLMISDGSDTISVSFAQAVSDAVSFNFGPDGPGTSSIGSWALNLAAGVEGTQVKVLDADANSLPLLTTSGQQVYLYDVGGIIVGATSQPVSTVDESVVFQLSVDSSGLVTLTQLQSIDHYDPTDNNELLQLADGQVFVNAVASITDSNGDSAAETVTVDLGNNVGFYDDYPEAIDEPSQDVAEGTTVTGVLDFVQGADGATVTKIGSTTLIFGDDGYSQTIDIGDGSIKVKADGTYSFTADNPVNGIGSASSTFTVTDGDGDTAVANVSFSITDANTPTGGTTTARVDDDGLTGPPAGNPASTTGDLDANVGDAGPNTSEAVYEGTLNFNFGLDGAGKVTFASMNGSTGTVGLENVTYAWNADTNTLTATGPRGALFQVEVTNTATGAYKLTLLDNVLNAGGPNDEATDATAALTYLITDKDGSFTTGTLNVTLDDDAPTASNEASQSVAEGTTVTGVLDFVQGADGATVTKIGSTTLIFGDDGYSQTIDIGDGSIKVKADGTYSFTADNPVNGIGSASSTFTVTDGDGDTAVANVSFSITDANTPTGGTTTARVDDDGLTGPPAGNPASTTGDLDANVGDAGPNTSEAVYEGTLNFNFGLDGAGKVTFASMNGSTGTVGLENVTYAWNADTNTLTATGPRGALFQVEVTNTATGAYKLTLLDNVLNEGGPNDEATDATAALTYLITDKDGSFTTGTLNVTLDDDAPTASNEASQSVAEGTTVTGVLDFVQGADGATVTKIGSTTLIFGDDGYSQTIDIGDGSIKVKADGTYSFTADNPVNGIGSASSTFTVTDGDGDTAVANVSFSITDANTPTGGTTTARVDDDGLTGPPAGNPASITGDLDANVGDAGPNTSEAVYEGTLNFNFGLDGAGKVTFASMNGSTGTVGLENVTYAWNADTNTLTATGPRGALFQVEVTNTATGAYKLTLLDNVLNAGGPNDEATDATAALTYLITDKDGSFTTGTLNVTLDDDAPTASNEASQSVAEGTTVTGVLDFVQGADGATVTKIGSTTLIFGDDGYSQTIDIGDGSIKVKADGTYSFTADNPVNGIGSASSTFTVTDGDGDTAVANVSFSITDANTPTGGTTTARVDDDGLTGPPAGNPASTTGDLDANVGDAGPNTSEAVYEGTLNFNFGLDGAGKVTFASMNGSTGTVGLENVTYAWNADTNTLTATGPRGALFQVEVTNTATGAYKLTLLDNVLNAGGPNDEATDATAALTYLITDKDGSFTTGTLNVTLDDDAPTASNEASQSVAEGTTVTGVLDFVQGADGATVTKIGSTTLIFGDDGYSQTIDIGDGSIKVKADGTYSFTADNPVNGIGSASSTFTVTDGDGDTAVANVSFSITDANTPTGGTTTARVDDDGLTGPPAGNPASTTGDLDANVGDAGPNTSEAVYEGTLNFNFGLDGAGKVTFASMNGSTGTVGLENVTYAWNADTNTLTATGPRGALFQVEVTNTATGAYKLTLLDNVLNAGGPNDEATDATAALTYLITDKDGSFTTGTLNVTLDDDAPTASNEASQSVAEGTTVTGVLDFVQGADGATVTKIGSTTLIFGDDGYSQTIDIGDGSIKVKADGTYSFTADNPVNGIGSASSTFTVTDGDGDTAVANVSFSITDANTPTGGTTTARVDDDGLTGPPAGNPASTTGDLDANVGDAGPNTSEAVYEGTLNFNFGLDGAGKVTFASMNGSTGTVGLENVTYAWNADTNTLTATGPRGALFQVEVTNTATGAYKLTLLDNVLNAGGPNDEATDATAALTYLITDKDGSFTTGTLNVTLDDDAPTASNEASQSVAEGTTVTGVLDFVQGADGATVTKIGSTTLIFGDDGYSQTIDIGDGSIKVKADGTYSFTADNPVNGIGSASSTFTVTDGDGDTAVANVSFSITDANTPTGGTTTARVDDDGLTGPPAGNPASTTGDLDANVGDAGPNTSEAVYEGTLNFNFGLDGAGKVTFASMNGSTGTVGLENVTYAWNADTNTLTATGPRGALFQVEVTNTATGAYKLTLLDNVLNAGGPNDEATDATAALTYLITDKDGSFTTGTLNVTLDDDAPTASNEASQSVAEGTTVTGVLDFVQGADGATVTKIGSTTLIFGDDGYSQTIDIGDGSIKVKADGTYSFTADNPVNGIGSASSTFTVTDGDGDTAVANVSFSITDANTPTGGTTTARVDDDGLTGPPAGNPASTTGDLDANVGDAGPNTSEAVYEGTLNFNFGLDGAGKVTFASMNGSTGTVGLENVTYAWNADTNTLTATGPRGALFQVEVTNTATGAYKLTLLDNVLNAGGPNDEATDATAALTYLITDKDGSFTTGTLNVTLDDDAPTSQSFELWAPSDHLNMTGVYAPGYAITSSVFASAGVILPGADGLASFTITSLPTEGTLYYYDADAYKPVYLNQSWSTIPTLWYKVDADSDEEDVSLVFKITDSDGDTTSSTVYIHTVTERTAEFDSGTVGDGDNPLTSGRIQNGFLTVSDGLAAAVPTSITIVTDFQQNPNTIPFSSGEITDSIANAKDEVSVYIRVDGVLFAVVLSDLADENGLGLNQVWAYDSVNNGANDYTYGQLFANISLNNIYRVTSGTVVNGGDSNQVIYDSSQSLAAYLLANPLVSGETLEILYDDNSGGNYQARSLTLNVNYVDPGNDGIVVYGDNTAAPDGSQNTANSGSDIIYGSLTGNNELNGQEGNDFIYGGDNADILRGGAGDDYIEGRVDADLIVGGTGKDTMHGGDGADRFSYSKADLDGSVDYLVDFVSGVDKIVFTSAASVGIASQVGGLLVLSITWTDSSSSTVTIQVPTGSTILQSDLLALATPVVIDLDRSGSISYLSTADGVSHDYFGVAVDTAWVSASDGIFVYDYNHDGLIAEAKEFVFTMWADGSHNVSTDMQALAAYFDTDRNGVFNADDAMWDYFGVWQDLNTDGIQQDGEFYGLDHWGITSISLGYDEDSVGAYTTADGDVQVFGQMTVTYDTADHTGSYTGLAEDMAFAAHSSDPVVVSSLSTPTGDSLDVQSLVTSYLDLMVSVGGTDADGHYDASHGTGELAYHLDAVITDFMETQGLSDSDYAHIHQQVLDHLALDLNDVIPGTDHDLSFNDQGHVADDAAVLAALDQHFQEVLDLHNGVDEFAQHDIVVSDHMSV